MGTIATKKGLLFANTSELFVEFTGKGGHAAYPHQANDMVVAAAHFITQIQTIVSRNIDPLDSAVVTIGKLTSGTVQNIIAETAVLEGTIRTLSVESMTLVRKRIEQFIKGFEISFNCQIKLNYGSSYLQVSNDEVETECFLSFLEDNKNIETIICKEAMTGEDFGYMLEKIPGFMFWLGVDSEFGLHHANLQPKEEAIPFAIKVITDFLLYRQGSV